MVFFRMLSFLSWLFLGQHLTTLGLYILTVLSRALQVLQQRHQRRWGRRPAGSLAHLSPGEVELWALLSNSVRCLAEAAWCQLDQFERSKLLMVPRLSLDAMVFFRMLSFLSWLFLGQHLTTLGLYILTVLSRALQVLQQRHQRRWGRRPAGSLAHLSPGEVELWALLSNSVRCVAASSQWRMARAAWCTRHPRGGVAPRPWRPRLDAASGALGGCGGCGVARVEVMVELLCTTCECLPSFEPSCERLLSLLISMSPLYMRLQVGKWPEILNPEVFYFWGNMLHCTPC